MIISFGGLHEITYRQLFIMTVILTYLLLLCCTPLLFVLPSVPSSKQKKMFWLLLRVCTYLPPRICKKYIEIQFEKIMSKAEFLNSQLV